MCDDDDNQVDNREMIVQECETLVENGRIFDAMKLYDVMKRDHEKTFEKNKSAFESLHAECMILQDLIFKMDQTSKWEYIGHGDDSIVYKEEGVFC